MPNDEERKHLVAEQERTPHSSETNLETAFDPQEHINEEAHELLVQIQHALDQLPALHEDVDMVRELEELKSCLEQVRRSFSSRLGHFLSSPRQALREWQNDRQEDALKVADNPKIISEIARRLEKIIKNLKKYDKEHGRKPSENDYSMFYPAQIFGDVQQISDLYFRAQKEQEHEWYEVERALRNIVNFRIRCLLYQTNEIISLEARTKLIDKALQLWEFSPDNNSEMARKLYDELRIRDGVEVEDLKWQEREKGTPDDEIAKKVSELKKRQLETLKSQHPDLYVFYAVVGMPRDEDRILDSTKVAEIQQEALGLLRGIPHRLAIAAEFKLETQEQGLRRDLLEGEAKQQLFDAYIKYDPKKIIDDMGFFQDEVERLPMKEKEKFVHDVLPDYDGMVSKEECLKRTGTLLSYVRVNDELFYTIKRNIAYKIDRLSPLDIKTAGQEIKKIILEKYPLALFTNPQLFVDVHILQEENLQRYGSGSMFDSQKILEQKVEFLAQIIQKREKYPFFHDAALQKKLWDVCMNGAIIKMTAEDGESISDEKFSIGLRTIVKVYARQILEPENFSNIKEGFLYHCNRPEILARNFLLVYDTLCLQGGKPNLYSTERRQFYGQMFGIDFDKDSREQGKQKIFNALMEHGSPRVQAELLYAREFNDIFPDGEKVTLAKKIIAHGEPNSLHVLSLYSRSRYYPWFDRDLRLLLTVATIEKGLAKDLSSATEFLAGERISLSLEVMARLRERIISEGESRDISALVRGSFDAPRDTQQRAVESLIERGEVSHIIDCLDPFRYFSFKRVMEEVVSNEQAERMVGRIVQDGKANDAFTALKRAQLPSPDLQRVLVDKIVAEMPSSALAIEVLTTARLADILTHEDKRKCVEKVRAQGFPSEILTLVNLHDSGVCTLSNEEEADEFVDLYILRGGGLEFFAVVYPQRFERRMVAILEEEERQTDWGMMARLPKKFISENKTSLLRRAEVLSARGATVFAAKLKEALADESEFDTLWAELITAGKKVDNVLEKLKDDKFQDYSHADKEASVYAILGAQELMANKNLRLRLHTAYLEQPVVLPRQILQRLPVEMRPAFGLLKGKYQLATETVERVGQTLFVGQALKKQTDRDRFFYFLLEGNEPSVMQKFFDASLPLMEEIPETKRKVVEVTQILRSVGFLQGGFTSPLGFIIDKLRAVDNSYQDMLAKKRKDYNDKVRAEIYELDAQSIFATDERARQKIEAKIIKRKTQLERGPEARELAAWKKEAAVGVVKEFDAIIDEYNQLLPKLFTEKCEIDLTAEEVNRFLEKFKDPHLVFVYLGKLAGYPHQKKLFQQFIEAVAKGKLSETRYAHREHLDKVFAGNDRLEKLWRMNSKLGVKGEEKAKGEEGNETMAKQRIKEFISEAIRHAHVEGEYAEVLGKYLEAPDVGKRTLRKEFYDKVAALPPGKELTAQEKVYVAVLHTMKLLTAKASSLKLPGFKEKVGEEVEEKKWEEIIGEIGAAFAEDSPFQNDLQAIQSVITQLKTEKKDQSTSLGFYAAESEDPDLLLRMGTDVAGSCQNVNGTPNLNRNLISYIMDGKIKTIFVRDSAGEIVSRAIMKIMYDEQNNTPVINLEHSYHRSDAPVALSNNLLFNLACEKAKKMGIPLAISAKFRANQELPPYDGSLVSYGGPGDTEYVDTIGGSHPGQKYTIPGENVFWVSASNDGLEVESLPNYTWESRAA